jgi:hypothetical protein
MASPVGAENCNPNMVRNAPDSRYTVLDGGAEALDHRTGLVWQRCSLGQSWDGATCAGTATYLSWAQALEAARLVGDGWRLPNQKELQSLVEFACWNPSINNTVFPITDHSSNYWTSSPVAGDGGYAWSIGFNYGYDAWSDKDDTGYVRMVRSGQ